MNPRTVNPRIEWADLFFSLNGRAGALPSAVAAAVLVFVLLVYESVVKGGLQMMGWVVYPAFLYMGACVLAKRLHDRGRTGWWAAIILLAIAMVWPNPQGFLDFIAVLLLLWAFVELCIMPGERGDNRYGKTLYRGAAA